MVAICFMEFSTVLAGFTKPNSDLENYANPDLKEEFAGHAYALSCQPRLRGPSCIPSKLQLRRDIATTF